MKQYECKDCPNRTRACHENCESYLAIKKARAEEKKAREERYEFIGYYRVRTQKKPNERQRAWLSALGRV